MSPNPFMHPSYEQLEEEQEVLDTDPSIRAEIDDNPEPELVEPTPENYFEEGSDEETGVLNSEDQPEFLSNYGSDYDSDSDDFSGSMAAPAA
jgi:hypothetical protein